MQQLQQQIAELERVLAQLVKINTPESEWCQNCYQPLLEPLRQVSLGHTTRSEAVRIIGHTNLVLNDNRELVSRVLKTPDINRFVLYHLELLQLELSNCLLPRGL